MPSKRFNEAIARFDAANAEDSSTETVAGTPQPKELLYARRMSTRLAPQATEVVQLDAAALELQRPPDLERLVARALNDL